MQPRAATAIRETILLVAFLLLVVAGIVTVVIPELRDDAHESTHRAGARDAGPPTPH